MLEKLKELSDLQQELGKSLEIKDDEDGVSFVVEEQQLKYESIENELFNLLESKISMEEHASSINLYFSNILEERDALQEALNSSFVQHDHTKDQLEILRAALDEKMAEISFKKVQVDEYNFRINQKFLQLRGEIDNKEKLIEELKLQLECESIESSDTKNFI